MNVLSAKFKMCALPLLHVCVYTHAVTVSCHIYLRKVCTCTPRCTVPRCVPCVHTYMKYPGTPVPRVCVLHVYGKCVHTKCTYHFEKFLSTLFIISCQFSTRPTSILLLLAPHCCFLVLSIERCSTFNRCNKSATFSLLRRMKFC